MSGKLPVVSAVRHVETEWSRSGRHTGLMDLPLTERGERHARVVGERLRAQKFAAVFTSPLQRASRTCALAVFGDVARIDADLVEWDYGEYEGITTTEILAKSPDWKLFRDGCPDGESPGDVAARADRVVARVRAVPGDVLIVSSGHFLRSLAARWLGQPIATGAQLVLGTASLSVLGYDHDLTEPAIRVWNDASHVTE
jgi:broad specificity phosphatase PhoE